MDSYNSGTAPCIIHVLGIEVFIYLFEIKIYVVLKPQKIPMDAEKVVIENVLHSVMPHRFGLVGLLDGAERIHDD